MKDIKVLYVLLDGYDRIQAIFANKEDAINNASALEKMYDSYYYIKEFNLHES